MNYAISQATTVLHKPFAAKTFLKRCRYLFTKVCALDRFRDILQLKANYVYPVQQENGNS